MKKHILLFIFLISFIIVQSQTNSVLLQPTELLENVLTDLEISNNNIYIASLHLCDPDTTDNSTITCTGISLVNMEFGIQKTVILDSLFPEGSNRLLILDEKDVYLTGHPHDVFNQRPTLVNIFDENLNQEFKINIDNTGNGIVNNEGIVSIDSFLYLHGKKTTTNKSYTYIQKFDRNFNLIWDFLLNRGLANNTSHDLQSTTDGNLIYIHEWNDGAGAVASGTQIMKIDSDGNKIDSLEFGSHHSIPAVLASNTGHIYCSSERDPLDMAHLLNSHGHVNKYSEDMDSLLWSIQLPFNNLINERRYRIYDIKESHNGDILVCGEAWDASPSVFIDPVNKNWSSFYARLSTSGEILNLRVYKTLHNNPILPADNYSKYLESALNQIHELDDGRIILGGTANYSPFQSGPIFPSGENRSWIWLMTVSPDGCIDGEECQEVIVVDGERNNATPIFPIGTKWTYEYFPNSIDPNTIIHSYITYEVTDTATVNDTLVYTITNNRNLPDEKMIQGVNEVWFWNDTQWQLTYDFDAINSYETIYDSPPFLTNTTVDIVDRELFTFGERGVVTLQHTSTFPNGTLEEDPLEISILERCGNVSGGLGLRLGLGLNLWDPSYSIGNLRCFDQDTFSFNFDNPPIPTIACDSVWTEIINSTTDETSSLLNIYPNPTSKYLYGIDVGSIYQLRDIHGRLYQTGIADQEPLEIKNNGISMLSILIDDIWHSIKVIKQD